MGRQRARQMVEKHGADIGSACGLTHARHAARAIGIATEQIFAFTNIVFAMQLRNHCIAAPDFACKPRTSIKCVVARFLAAASRAPRPSGMVPLYAPCAMHRDHDTRSACRVIQRGAVFMSQAGRKYVGLCHQILAYASNHLQFRNRRCGGQFCLSTLSRLLIQPS